MTAHSHSQAGLAWLHRTSDACLCTGVELHRIQKCHPLLCCKDCMGSNCPSCKQEQQSSSHTEAAAEGQLCLRSQEHPDSQDLRVVTLFGSSSIKIKQQQQETNALSSLKCSVDQAAPAVVPGSILRTTDISSGSQQQGATRKRFTTPAAVADDVDHSGTHHRSSHDYDLVVEMAAAAAAAARGQYGHDSQLAAALNSHNGHDSKLQQDVEDVQRLQADLQSAVECWGAQREQLPLAPAPPRRPQGSKHESALGPALTLAKRRRLEQQQQQQELAHPSAVSAAGGGGANVGLNQPQPQQQQSMISGPSPSNPVYPRLARAAPVPRCGQCKTCNNLQLRKGCACNRWRHAQGLPFLIPPGADRIPRSAAKRHALTAARALTAASSGATADAGNGLHGLLLSSAGFGPVSSAAAVGHWSGSATAAAARQAGHAVPSLVIATFAPAFVALPAHAIPAAMVQHKGEAGAKLQDQQQQQQQQQQLQGGNTAAPATGAFCSPEGLLESVSDRIGMLCSDVSDWCSSNLVADRADVTKTLQVIRELKQQLWHNYQQTGQQLFINGLEILGEIVGAFTALPAAGTKVVLASNCQRRVSGACCPDNQPCSVLELIMFCWFKEMQDSGVTGVKADWEDTVTAAGGSARQSSGVVKQQEVIRSGQCQAALRLIAQLSSLQYQVYYGPLAAGAELQQIEVHKDVAVALRDAVIHVMSGTALLMLQGPEVESAQECSRWGELAAEWQLCLLQCKWAVTSKQAVGSAGSAVVSVLRELGRVVDQLTALRSRETSSM